VLEAGQGEPLIYFHGAGTTSGFQELLPLATNRRLIVPIHPGFGASQDDAAINSMLDYVVHYNALFDQMGLVQPIDIVGHSLGGWIASLFTVLNGHRVRRLALACPAGLRVPEYPTADLFMIRPEQVMSRILATPQALARVTSAPPTTEMKIARYREMTTLARVIWDRNYDPKLNRWLGRITVPTLILWGQDDHIIPVEQAKFWSARLAESEVTTFANAGHLLFFETPAAIARLQSFFDTDVVPRRKAAG
jgi:pimeloyl-ACP methyl ester carboxylesterase